MQFKQYAIGKFTRQGIQLPAGSKPIKLACIKGEFILTVRETDNPSIRYELMIQPVGRAFKAPVAHAEYLGSMSPEHPLNLFWWVSPCQNLVQSADNP